MPQRMYVKAMQRAAWEAAGRRGQTEREKQRAAAHGAAADAKPASDSARSIYQAAILPN